LLLSWVSWVRVGGCIVGFCGSLFPFCFLFLGVPFVYLAASPAFNKI